ncbi:MAG: DEAD/DEAH box helicase [Planctomycetota bacterium]
MTNDTNRRRRNRRSRPKARTRQETRDPDLRPARTDEDTRTEEPSRATSGPKGGPVDAGEFSTFGLHASVLRGVAAAGFTEARPIQRKAIPSVLQGRDVLGLAQTGTGKTAAFALPILERLREKGGPRRGPRALVVAPTRELANQIHEEFGRLGEFTRVRSTTVFGGVPQGSQVRALSSRPEVVVACPGRLLDLVDQGHVDLSDVEVLVLDEADHMFDMGFLPSVRRILKALPGRRQNLLFSATMPKEIRRLADDVLRKPAVVELAHSRPADTIEHGIYACAQDRRVELLEHLLDGDDFTSAIVFLRTKHRARRVAKQLDARGHRAVALQGNMSQNQRVRAMEAFRRGDYDVLVATDIAARGIDVANVSHVVNFDVPNTPDAYTHRIGRTGRSEKEGKAFTFADRDDEAQIKAIEKHLGQRIPRLKLEGFDAGRTDVRSSTGGKNGGAPAGGGRGPRGGAGRGGSRGSSRGGGGGGPRRGKGGPRGRGSSGPTGFARPNAPKKAAGAAKPSTARASGPRRSFGDGV